MKQFDNVLSITERICEFIFSHSEIVPPEISAFSIGISSSVVSVRYKGHGIYGDDFEGDAMALYETLKGLTGDKFFIVSFMDGMALRLEFSQKGLTKTVREDNAPEGALFRVETTDGKDASLKDKQLFANRLSPLFKETFPDSPEIEIYFNADLVNLL
jgi:hypothetical protein